MTQPMMKLRFISIILLIVTVSASRSSSSRSSSSSSSSSSSRWTRSSSSSSLRHISKDIKDMSMEWGEYESTSTPKPTNTDSQNSDKCLNECTDNIQMPNFCDYASDLWDEPNTPLDDRNNIGMAKYLTASHTLKALALGKLGKVYKLSYEYTNSLPAFGSRSWYTSLKNAGGAPWGVVSAYYEFDKNNNTQCGSGWGYLDQRLMTSAVGNSGTQLDGLGHVYYINGEFGDQRNYLFFNGFTGASVMQEHGVEYIGVEQLPPFITRAILIDVSGYIEEDPLPGDFQIDTEIVEETLKYQGMSVDDIEEGDVLLFYTGWADANWYGDSDDYYSQSPGIILDTVVNIFGPKKVLLLGSDSMVEYVALDGPLLIPIHMHWIVCHGGFLYENLKLVEWVQDARNGDVPYIGGFYYAPAQIQGGVGGLGTPMVIV